MDRQANEKHTSEIDQLFENNRSWAAQMAAQDEYFFKRLSARQAPPYFWIGCSDSRVPPDQITGMPPGNLFVHRNVANVVTHLDLNCLSAMQYAVDVLRVKHIIVCGHYGCGGVQAVLRGDRLGILDDWLRNVQDVYQKHENLLASIKDEKEQWARLCALNVIEQATNVCRTTIAKDAWARGQELAVHGWIYDLNDGLLMNLKFCVVRSEDDEMEYQNAIQHLSKI